jgi:hypothetical protein
LYFFLLPYSFSTTLILASCRRGGLWREFYIGLCLFFSSFSESGLFLFSPFFPRLLYNIYLATHISQLGGYHSCAMLVADASISCWGNGSAGMLGTADRNNAAAPVPATVLNAGSANVQLVAAYVNT